MVPMKALSFSFLSLWIEQSNVDGFLIPNKNTFGIRKLYSSSAMAGDDLTKSSNGIDANNNNELEVLASKNDNPTIVEAPLKYQGPYPCLGLRFPNLATASQRERNVTGISLDFVVDTAANVNTLNLQVAQELGLDIVGQALPGLGAAGAIDGADTYMLGDCELEKGKIIGNPEVEGGEINIQGNTTAPFIFMSDLTASALQIAAPTAAGILSLAFLQCFPGGVEFTWGQTSIIAEDKDENARTLYPSMTFHADETTINVEQSKRAIITPIPVTSLPSIRIKINGVEMPALLDTGSPITVLNHQAAKAAGIDTVFKVPEQSNNPFSNIANNFKLAQAASRGEVLALAGVEGQPVYLLKANDESDNNVAILAEDGSDINFDRNENDNSQLYIGDLPGLAALNGIGVDSPPAVVLGVDVLRRRSRMLFRGQQNEVYF